MLLMSRANPLVARKNEDGDMRVPLDAAAECGRLEVVRELTEAWGIKNCGGDSSVGDKVLSLAARSSHMGAMAVLVDAEVMDSGRALIAAAEWGGDSPVKFLLEQQRQELGNDDFGALANYVDTADALGRTPLICSIHGGPSSRRVVRLLVDAGADTMSAVRLRTPGGMVEFEGTPLAYTARSLTRTRVLGVTLQGRAAARPGGRPPLAAAGGGFSRSVLVLTGGCPINRQPFQEDCFEIAEDDSAATEATGEEARRCRGSSA